MLPLKCYTRMNVANDPFGRSLVHPRKWCASNGSGVLAPPFDLKRWKMNVTASGNNRTRNSRTRNSRSRRFRFICEILYTSAQSAINNRSKDYEGSVKSLIHPRNLWSTIEHGTIEHLNNRRMITYSASGLQLTASHFSLISFPWKRMPFERTCPCTIAGSERCRQKRRGKTRPYRHHLFPDSRRKTGDRGRNRLR